MNNYEPDNVAAAADEGGNHADTRDTPGHSTDTYPH